MYRKCGPSQSVWKRPVGAAAPNPTGMGFSLIPPAWLRNLVSSGVQAADKLSQGAQAAQRTLNAARQAAQPPDDTFITAGGQPVPNWILPVGIAALAAVFILPKILKGSR